MSAKTAAQGWQGRPIDLEEVGTMCPDRDVSEERMIRVLVVDDEEPVLDLVKAMLEVLGFEVEAAADGYEGLETFRRERFDVVITDFIMPRMNGCVLAQKVKELSPHTPVVMVTGFSREDIYAMTSIGLFEGVLLKPFSMYDLQKLLRSVL